VSSDGDFRRIAIVGVGLIGGSLAFAVRRRFPEVTIVGVDRDDVVTAARQLGALSQGTTDLAGIAGADLVILAAPVVANLDVMAKLPSLLDRPAIVTDVGSTKRATLEAARALPPHLQFIGGHPLAGAAKGGIEASRPDLFERRTWVLTPSLTTPRETVERVSAFVRAVGAMPLELDADTHDRVLAFTSHLPQLTASALMQVVGDGVGDQGLQFSGGGLADTTRVAASPARIWTDICRTNADELIPALDQLIESLQSARRDLASARSLEPLFESAQRWRGKLKP
jgi:prephenate dehydrogenase